MTSLRTVAAFDFDGTLSRRDSFLPFLQHVCGANRLYRAITRLAPTTARMIAAGHVDRDVAKDRLLVSLLRGRPLDELVPIAERYADLLADTGRLRADVVGRAEWHAVSGHERVIVSASPSLYLVPLGKRLGFDAVLATDLEVDGDGRLTGRMAGANCRGAEKVARLESWLDGSGDAGHVRLYAYGNSIGDRELLARADVGELVQRRRPISRRPEAAPL